MSTMHRLLSSCSSTGYLSGAARLLGTESDGLAGDFTDMSMQIKDTTTPANNYASAGRVSNGALVGPGGKITFSSPSPKLCLQSDGTYKYQAHNLYLNSAAPANQSITVRSGESYTITLTGSVSIILSGATTGTVTAGSTVFTAASGTLTCGSTSGSGTVHVRLTNSNTDYIATTSAAVYDLPYEWGTSGNPLGVSVEEARTNLALRSQEFDNASWTKSSFTITANAAVAPDGNTTADRLTATAGGNQIFSAFAALADSSNYTGSFYIKKSVGNWVYILLRDKANVNNIAWFNIGTGAKGSTTGTISAYTIDALPNSWYRISATFNTATGATVPLFFFGTATGDTATSGTTGDSVYLWQAQLELGSFATSPIATTGSTVTRAQDNISMLFSLFPSIATTGYVYAKTYGIQNDVSNDRVIVTYGTGAASLLYAATPGSNNKLGCWNGSAGFSTANTATWSSTNKSAIGIGASSRKLCLNGGAIASDANSVGALGTTMYLGIRGSLTLPLNGYIQQIFAIPRTPSDAELQTVTT